MMTGLLHLYTDTNVHNREGSFILQNIVKGSQQEHLIEDPQVYVHLLTLVSGCKAVLFTMLFVDNSVYKHIYLRMAGA